MYYPVNEVGLGSASALRSVGDVILPNLVAPPFTLSDAFCCAEIISPTVNSNPLVSPDIWISRYHPRNVVAGPRKRDTQCGGLYLQTSASIGQTSSYIIQLFNRILAPYVENLDMNQVNYGIGQGSVVCASSCMWRN